MSVVLVKEMPGATRALVEEITAEMQFERTGAPTGLIVHTATKVDGGIRIIDVWESQEAFTNFERTRLQPATTAVADRHGIDLSLVPEPPPCIDDAFDVVVP